MVKNSFGLRTYEIKEVFRNKDVEAYIRKTFAFVLKHLGISSKRQSEIINSCLDLAKNYNNITEYERDAHKIIQREGVIKKIPHKLSGRSTLIYKQIKPHVIKGKILDLGCGNGKVGDFLAKEKNIVHLTDVYKHSHINNLDLEFKLFGQGEKIPFTNNTFDTTLLLVVLHHTNNPSKTLKEAMRVTKPGGRIIVIESVYGVNGKEIKTNKKRASSYLSLTKEQQRMANTFFDHFYNRIIFYSEEKKNKVNVPFNFNTPEGWKKFFEKEGCKQERVIHLGIDQLIVPEYHTLHILKVKK